MYRKNHNVIYLNKENLSVTFTFYIVFDILWIWPGSKTPRIGDVYRWLFF